MARQLYLDELWLKRISEFVNGLEYGTVQIVVHDGKIVQLERTERRRFDKEHASGTAAANEGRDSFDKARAK